MFLLAYSHIICRQVSMGGTLALNAVYCGRPIKSLMLDCLPEPILSQRPISFKISNVTIILPNLAPNVTFWKNSITLKKAKKNQRKNLWSYKKYPNRG